MGVPREGELRQIVPVMFARHRDGAFSGPHILRHRKFDRVKVQHYSSKGSTTLRAARPLSWPDGALAFDVMPFELPTRRVDDGIRVLTRRERRHEARRGHRGRRGSVAIPKMMRLWTNEPYEPEVPELRIEYVEFRRMRVRFSIKLCGLCECELRVILTLYAATESPHVVSEIWRGLQRAVQSFAIHIMEQHSCFCGH